MQILLFEEITASALYGLIQGLYGTLAKVYDFMLNLVEKTNMYDFGSFTQTLYVIVGIFMLFRVVISILNYIINPDQVSDSNAGAGKMLTRVVLAIVMLIAFSPSGFIFKPEGLLDRTQQAIIGEDGFLDHFMSANESSLAYDNNSVKTTKQEDNPLIAYSSNLLYEDVNAASNKKTCYFLTTKFNGNKQCTTECRKGKNSPTCLRCKEKIKADENNSATIFHKIDFYKASNDTKYGVQFSSKSKMTANVVTDSEGGIDFKSITIASNASRSDAKSVANCANWALINQNGNYKISHKGEDADFNQANFKGYNSLKEVQNAYSKILSNGVGLNGINTGCENGSIIDPYACEEAGNHNKWLPGVANDAIEFSTGLVSTFQECTGDNSEECETAKQEQFGLGGSDYEEASNNIISYMADGKLNLEFIMALVAGLAVIVFIIILCIDVVVRNLKLMLLKMMAPIAIVSYVDPKDKVFSAWGKMFINVFLDLFIKLFAIKIAIILLGKIAEVIGSASGIEYFFVICGVLVFAKAIPSMISKLFGLELNTSFKDITGMAKAGIGLAAGASLAAGAATAGLFAKTKATKGQTKGQRALAFASGVGNIFTSTLRGGAAGTKGIGNATKAASSTFSKSWNKAQQYKEGISEGQMIAGAMFGGALSYAATVDRANKEGKEQAEALEKFTKFKGAIEDTAESGKFMKTLRQNVATGNLKLDENTMQDYRDTWVEYQIISDSNSAGLAAAFSCDALTNRQTFKNNLQRQVNSGNLTQDQMNTQLKNYDTTTMSSLTTDEERIAYKATLIEESTGIRIGEEAGKQAGIVSTMTQANATLEGSKTVRDVAGVSSVTSFADLKDTNTKVKKEATRISDEIFRTEADDKYQASKAAMEAAKGNSGNK